MHIDIVGFNDCNMQTTSCVIEPDSITALHASILQCTLYLPMSLAVNAQDCFWVQRLPLSSIKRVSRWVVGRSPV